MVEGELAVEVVVEVLVAWLTLLVAVVVGDGKHDGKAVAGAEMAVDRSTVLAAAGSMAVASLAKDRAAVDSSAEANSLVNDNKGAVVAVDNRGIRAVDGDDKH